MTLKELLDQNKDKFVNGRLKVRRDSWDESRWFEVVGVGTDSAIGFEIDGCGSCYPFIDNGNEWELFVEPKPKKRLWPFLVGNSFLKDEYAVKYLAYQTLKNTDHKLTSYIPHPTLPPIEVEE